MLYFSELKGKKVETEDHIEVGRLEDLIFLASENPTVTKLLIRDKRKNRLIIPVNYLKKLNKEVILSKDYTTGVLGENELHIMRNLLDKQIIDLKGNKIVRVNDVIVGRKNGDFYISGVDTGLLAIFRWLGLEGFICEIQNILNLKPSPQLLSWVDIQPLELTHGQVKLKKKQEKLEKMKPEDLADYLERTNIRNVRRILGILDEKFAASVIGSLNINYQTSIFRHFAQEKVAKIISLIDPDEAVDILLTLSKRRRDEIITLLEPEKKREINYLLFLSRTPIGDILTTEFISVNPDNTVREVIETIKRDTVDYSFLAHIYVINKEKQLVGVFNLHELLLQELNTSVYKFMIQSVVVAHLTTPREIILRIMIKYKLTAIPVIDAEKHILGIVTFDDIGQFMLKSTG